MKPAVEVDGARVFLGDCRDVLKSLPDNSVDSIVTDPPYELGFMGKSWDNSGIAYDVTVWEECLRVLKPGGHILAFGGTRTWHRLAVAIEDAGFEIRDNICWLYGSGFPKSLDVSKAIDKKVGAQREVVGSARGALNGNGKNVDYGTYASAGDGHYEITAPASSEAEQWQGWGTALKPAFEPVVVGRKPIEGTVANNVLRWGVGGLNIDGSRIGAQGGTFKASKPDGKSNGIYGEGINGTVEIGSLNAGRWPANVVLDEFTAGLLDEQSGQVKGASSNSTGKSAAFTTQKSLGTLPGYNDTGGASRFFYQAKASKRDRNEGLETPSTHPTVKPTALMRYLIKLVTPESGVVLDPFTGSGSTGKAALLDGFKFVGAELTEEYLPIIEGRLRWAVENRDEDGTLF